MLAFRSLGRLLGSRPQTCSIASNRRHNSSSASPDFIKVNLQNNGVAQVDMNRKPANAMSLEFLQGMTNVINNLEEDPQCRGIVFTSSVPKIFSAGLEMTEIYQPDLARLETFWTALQEMWLTLYSTKLATVAAISGHAYAGGTTFAIACDSAVIVNEKILTGLYAPMLGSAPAGGCLLALTCDIRLFGNGKFKMGLNEVPLGIVVPMWLQDNMINVLGFRKAEYALQHGRLFTPEEALREGLVYQVVETENLSQAVDEAMEKLLNIPDLARQYTKQQVRESTIARFHARRKADLDQALRIIPGAVCQEILTAQIEKMKSKKK